MSCSVSVDLLRVTGIADGLFNVWFGPPPADTAAVVGVLIVGLFMASGDGSVWWMEMAGLTRHHMLNIKIKANHVSRVVFLIHFKLTDDSQHQL